MDVVPNCAVCIHLGRPCDETCILGPYFPVERIEDFQCVHKCFGISNLTKIVSSVEENERATTVETLILEAEMRLQDRMHGSVGVKKMLEAEVSKAEKELNVINQHLRFLRGGRNPNHLYAAQLATSSNRYIVCKSGILGWRFDEWDCRKYFAKPIIVTNIFFFPSYVE